MNEEQRQVQMSRQVEAPKDKKLEMMKTLGKLGYSRGLSTAEFRMLLDLLEWRFVRNSPTWAPNSPESYEKFRSGQNDVVWFIRNVLCEVPEPMFTSQVIKEKAEVKKPVAKKAPAKKKAAKKKAVK